MLQGSSSSKAGQGSPPFSASRTIPLPLVSVPPPQVALHLVHEDQSSTLQSAGGKDIVKPDEIVIVARIKMMIMVIIREAFENYLADFSVKGKGVTD